MSYKTQFAAFFSVMILFNLAANFAHPVTPTVIQELGLNDYMFGVALALGMADVIQSTAGYVQIDAPMPAPAIGGRRVCFLMNRFAGMIELLEKEG